ncbi:hypothetical protein NMG60_11019317 [Bertholletia excelsa]
MPNSLKITKPDLKFSLVVSLSSSVDHGRVILVMDKNFCTDSAGNRFMRTTNSSFLVHFDRRSVFVNIRSHVPEKLVQLNSEARIVQATNNCSNLKVYLYFSEPILNSSTEILNSLHASQGLLLPISGNSLQNRRFGFMVADISNMSIVTVSLNTTLIISSQGTPVSPVAPVTFLYDSQRPAVSLSTTSNTRTKENCISVLINFMKPVFGFNSSHVAIIGGHLHDFREVSRSTYIVKIRAENTTISISIHENVTQDVAGNKNIASNVLQVRHYSVPVISLVLSNFTTTTFALTALLAGMLALSTAGLQSIGAFVRPNSSLTSGPSRNLFRIACHIQIFALCRWLAVTLPIEFFEFVRGLQWSIPYFSLPWETGNIWPAMVGSGFPSSPHSYGSKIREGAFNSLQLQEWSTHVASSINGLPLSPKEYRSFFWNQNVKPEAEHISDPHNSNGWRDFNRSMFWLAVMSGSLMLLHVAFLLILKLRKKNSEKQGNYGALILPRFEIFLIILALPCICEASASLIKGRASSGVVLGALLLGIVAFLLLALPLFLSVGITLGKLLLYKEIHQEGQNLHWYRDLIRMTLGPGKRGQWTWKNQCDSVYVTMFGPLFEDLRGPPKYMLSQISRGIPQKHGDRIIASEDETEDAEAPFIQKLFGILRIYYTFLETLRRVCFGILAGFYLRNWSSRTPTISLLCITAFQLFFMVLKKPFIKKRVQLVEIISVSSELIIFATCFVLLKRELSTRDESKIGIFMLLVFLIAFLAQMSNEWYALYKQTQQLDVDQQSFITGLKMAGKGFLVYFIPRRLIKVPINQSADDEVGDNYPSFSDRVRDSGTTGRPWLKRIREMTRASFSSDRGGNPNDPSTSRMRWSGFWSGKRSGSSSQNSPANVKSRTRGLSKDLEAIFASK